MILKGLLSGRLAVTLFLAFVRNTLLAFLLLLGQETFVSGRWRYDIVHEGVLLVPSDAVQSILIHWTMCNVLIQMQTISDRAIIF